MLKSVGDKSLLYVMATDAEYGSELKQHFAPLICGVGPVEAALNTAKFFAGSKPDCVVSLGSAGSNRLEQAHVYQVSHVSYRDMDASAFGFEKGVTPFADFPATIELSPTSAKLTQASLSTGANVVAGDAYSAVDADMVDMETWSIKRVCMDFGIPLIGLRGISDGAEPVSEYSDWTRFLDVIDQRLAEAVSTIEADIASGTLGI